MRLLPRVSIRLLLFLLALAGVTGAFATSSSEDAARTVVVYNGNDPDAKGLADFYCAARGIDPSRQIALTAPLTEEISRSDYDDTVANPLRGEFLRRGYWMMTRDMMNRPIIYASRIRYVALVRGIPLKIKECGDYPGDSKIQPAPVGSCNAASVDSELSVLGLFTPQISGVLNNPMANSAPQTALTAQVPPALLLVARLDGPTVQGVKTMVLNGLKAEKEGLWGWGYTDLRSITAAGYVQGDQWIREAGDAMRRKGIPVISDDLPDTYQSGFPLTDAAAYFGWYSENIDGPFADPFFQFVPGAVAAHLHSFSATTLRDPSKGWTAPLILHGAGVSLGNVYEPYLSFTTHLGQFASSLLTGANVADSYYLSQPVLSWMSVLVGDPLYRPYAALVSPEEPSASTPDPVPSPAPSPSATGVAEASSPATPQTAPPSPSATPTPAPTPSTAWVDYRSIILAHRGDVLQAAGDLAARAKATGESLYLEALGSAQYDAGVLPAAGASFRDAAAIAKDPRVQFRLLLEQARVLEKQGQPLDGAALLRQGLIHFTSSSQRSLLLAWIQRLDPIKPAPTGK